MYGASKKNGEAWRLNGHHRLSHGIEFQAHTSHSLGSPTSKPGGSTPQTSTFLALAATIRIGFFKKSFCRKSPRAYKQSPQLILVQSKREVRNRRFRENSLQSEMTLQVRPRFKNFMQQSKTPLYLPTGSVRALLVLSLTGGVLIQTFNGSSISSDLFVVWSMIVGTYFGFRPQTTKL